MIRSKQHTILTVLMSFLLVLLCMPLTNRISASAAGNYIDDEAELLSSTEIEQLNEEIAEFKESYDTNLYIATVTTLDGEDKYAYAHNIGTQNDIGNGIVILYDYENNEEGKRTLVIQSFKDDINPSSTLAYDNITPERCDEITSSIASYFIDAEYYDGFYEAISLLSDTILVSPKEDNFSDSEDVYSPVSEEFNMAGEQNQHSFVHSIWGKSWVQLFISLAIGAIIVAIMLLNAGGKITTNSNTYLNQQSSRLIGHYDHYIRTQTTRRKRESSNSNSSNGSERSGGGGSSHGGSSTF